MDDAAIRRGVEAIATDPFFEGEGEEFRNTVRMIAAAIYLGSNADRLARFLGLNRDKFVRPRARRLRASGIFQEGSFKGKGKVLVDEDAWKNDQHLLLWYTLAGLVAEGLAIRLEGPCPPA